MAGAIQIEVDKASLDAMNALAKTMLARMKYLNESAQSASHAMMSDVARSLRAATKMAKSANIKPKVTPRADLKFSYYALGKQQEVFNKDMTTSLKVPVKMCVRNSGGVRIIGNAEGKIRFYECKGVPSKTIKCFNFVDKYDVEGIPFEDKYLIVTTTAGKAAKYAKSIIDRRILRYQGLARRALSVIMIKLFNKAPSERVGTRANLKAYEVTRTMETVGDGVYTLTASDNLRYAVDALRGGEADIDVSLRKAVNKVVGQLSHRFKQDKFFDPNDLPPVFTDVQAKRRSA